MDGHIGLMGKPSNREKILTEGLRVVHRQGFAGASVRDIVQAAGVPQGSFTNHFASKEAFGLEIIALYLERSRALIGATLRNDALSPLERLAAFIDRGKQQLDQDDMRDGCLFGNFAAEACDHSDAIRHRLVAIFAEVQDAVADCLRAAVAAGETPATLDCDTIAGFIVSSLQGANLLAKTERSPAPVDRFKSVLFGQVLR
jgi:TetR/AcrR family transcriptional regulator, transcriptional repressor for nem operon